MCVEQILPDDTSKKPQGKQLQARTDYLLKLLKKEQDAKDPSAAGEEVRYNIHLSVLGTDFSPED